jgi:hypothetical protein
MTAISGAPRIASRSSSPEKRLWTRIAPQRSRRLRDGSDIEVLDLDRVLLPSAIEEAARWLRHRGS